MLLLVVLNYDHKQRKKTFFIANTRDLVSLNLDGIDDSKAVEISLRAAKITQRLRKH